jgi:hypothetical protein
MKHNISSDRHLNPALAHEAGILRGGLLAQANANPLPPRFIAEPSKTSPSVFITDSTTGKQVEVPLFAYGDVRKVLATLFPSNETTSAEAFLPVGCITNDGKLVTKQK